mgnify:CR=1 FL=1
MLFVFLIGFTVIMSLFSGCNSLVHQERWGIYALHLDSNVADLIYSSDLKIETVRLNEQGTHFVFAQMVDGSENNNFEICSLAIDGSDFKRLTNNSEWDLYPTWSPDGSKIAFLTFRRGNLDIFTMDASGGNESLLFDSGGHDADIHWMGDSIVFTANSSIWIMDEDGSNAVKVTSPPRAGEWGNANLPFGDYDPMLSSDASLIAFERLEDDSSPHGNYNIFVIGVDGTNETRLTTSNYSQGFPTWSHDDSQLAFLVSAIGETGVYDLYLMNANGSDAHSITPKYFPDGFLCYAPTFSPDDRTIYFVGEWWE